MEIGNKNIKLEHLEEAYTTEHWLVRIYKVKKPSNRPKISYLERKIKPKFIFSNKKVSIFNVLYCSKFYFIFNRQVEKEKELLEINQL